jgi:ribosomal protein L40E
MIRCTKCGTVNPSDASFCTECNSYLEWSGQAVADEATPTAGEPSTTAEGSGSVPDTDHVPNANERRDGGVSSSQAKPPDAARDEPGDPPSPRVGPPQEPPAAVPQPAAVAPIARTPAAQPQSRKPTKSSAKPRPKPKPTPSTKDDRPRPGDLICPNCGTGNDATRKFCRRCGFSLAAAPVEPVTAAPPWYRRILRRREAPAVEAGVRPHDMGRRRWRPGCATMLVVLVLLLVIIAAGAYFAIDGVRGSVDGVARAIECRVLEQIRGTTSPIVRSPLAGDPGAAALDTEVEDRPTFWVGRPGSGMDVGLDQPSYLVRIQITPGERPDTGRPRGVFVREEDGSQGSRIASGNVPNAGEPFLLDVCARIQDFDLVVESLHQSDRDRFAIQRVDFVILRED